MKIKTFILIGLLCLSLTVPVIADGDPPGGGRSSSCAVQPNPITDPIGYAYWFFNC